MGVIFPHRSRGWTDFLYVCMNVCMCVCVCVSVCVCVCVCLGSRGRKQIGLVKSKVMFEDELCRAHRDPQGAPQKKYFIYVGIFGILYVVVCNQPTPV